MTDAPKFPIMAREFPDFDQATLPAIPEGFADESWHNDAAPSFYFEALELRLWADYANPAYRETFSGNRFTLQHEPRVDGMISNETSDLVSSDEWSEVLPHILAAAFAAELESELTPEQMATVRARNATPNYAGSVCASHDVCDANMPMAAAFETVMGREIELGEETPQSVADHALWNRAWDIAKPRYLTAETLPLGGDLDALAGMFGRWATHEELPEGDATDLLFSDLTSAQREWLSAFVVLWDAEQARLDNAAKES